MVTLRITMFWKVSFLLEWIWYVTNTESTITDITFQQLCKVLVQFQFTTHETVLDIQCKIVQNQHQTKDIIKLKNERNFRIWYRESLESNLNLHTSFVVLSSFTLFQIFCPGQCLHQYLLITHSSLLHTSIFFLKKNLKAFHKLLIQI